MRKTVPDHGSTVAALAERLDRVETRLTGIDELRGDVNALARGMAELSAQTRAVADHLNRRIVTAPDRRDAANGSTINPFAEPDDASSDGEPAGEQPNWLTVTDPALAGQWLVDAVAFADDVLAQLGHRPAPACWPLHAQVVVEVIALQAQYRSAYTSESVTEVSELLGRWLPGAAARIGKDLYACLGERAHRVAGRAYEIPHMDPLRVSAWWADTHGTDPGPVEAFALTPIR